MTRRTSRAARQTSDSRTDPAGARARGKTTARSAATMSATAAKNQLGELLLRVREVGPVFIERHGRPQAVVMDVAAYEKLTAAQRTRAEQTLDQWSRKFDELYAQMQSPSSAKAVDALFNATETQLNRRRRRR